MPRLLVPLVLLLAAFPSAAATNGIEWIDSIRAKLRDAQAREKVVQINPDRGYPSSCLSYPLPTTPRGTVVTKNMTLADIDGNSAGVNGLGGYFEQVSVSVWRVACSGGNSAVLVKFTRAANKQNTFPQPDIPIPTLTQGSNPERIVRPHIEPNTYVSDVFAHSIPSEAVVVLDEIPGEPVDFDLAFTLKLVTFFGNQPVVTDFAIAAYNAMTHPDGLQDLELNGYLTGAWYDDTHPGEGILFEVAEQPNRTRFVFFSWFTYDAQGRPYWLVGNANIANDARTVTIPTLYFGGGGFAGAFTPANVQPQAWGSVTFSFPSCNSMRLLFASTHSVSGIPTGSGMRSWQRLTTINGLGCE